MGKVRCPDNVGSVDYQGVTNETSVELTVLSEGDFTTNGKGWGSWLGTVDAIGGVVNATIKKIELVNGAMLSFTLALPAGMNIEQFDVELAIGNILNASTIRGQGIVNCFSSETSLKVGDAITETGEIIEAKEAQGKVETTTLVGKQADYRDSFNSKNKN
jgi:hypothetical protein